MSSLEAQSQGGSSAVESPGIVAPAKPPWVAAGRGGDTGTLPLQKTGSLQTFLWSVHLLDKKIAVSSEKGGRGIFSFDLSSSFVPKSQE